MIVKESFNVSSKDLVDRVKKIIREGNVRKVRLIHKDNVLVEIPLTIGAPAAAVGIIAAPALAAVAAIAAMVTECTVEVERAEKKKQD